MRSRSLSPPSLQSAGIVFEKGRITAPVARRWPCASGGHRVMPPSGASEGCAVRAEVNWTRKSNDGPGSAMSRGRCSCASLKLLRRRVVAPVPARRVASCARGIGWTLATTTTSASASAAAASALTTTALASTTAAATVSLAHCYALSIGCAVRAAPTWRQHDGHCANVSNGARDGRVC